MRGSACLFALVTLLDFAVVASDALYDELSRVLFFHSSTVRAIDDFTDISTSVSYNEPDNITCAPCPWSVGNGVWTYPWQRLGPEGPCNVSELGSGIDLPGNDLSAQILPASSDNRSCAGLCCRSNGCAAWVFEPATDAQMGTCVKGSPCCFLKSSASTPTPKSGVATVAGLCTAGERNVTSPPMGIRSAPPLGGVSAGSVELRADGSFREWTLLNAGPAGSGKYGIVDDVFMAARVDGTARVLRTHTPPSLTGHGVSSLGFSGTYPVTRLELDRHDFGMEKNIEMAIFAHSTLRPGDLNSSAYPALALTLSVANVGSEPTDVSFAFSLPFAAMTDTSRLQGNGNVGGSEAKDATACLHACHDDGAVTPCVSWHFDPVSGCRLNSDLPLTSHAATTGGASGVRNDGWRADGEQIFLVQRPLPEGARNPSIGDVSLRPVTGGGVEATFAASDNITTLFDTFQRDGGFKAKSLAPTVAAHGAVAVNATVQPGENKTLSIVFAWHFPDRDFATEILGNRYADLWPNSSEVSRTLATRGKLVATVRDINALHYALASPANPTPTWLKDMLLNQFSHVHQLMWFRDGRLREYEAFSCQDVDSVHNDFQRHLLYLWLFPEFPTQKLRGWGTFAQEPDGRVDEWLANGPYTSPKLDKPGGRSMGDTTSLFVLEMFEMWRNDASFDRVVREQWESVVRAINWMIGNARGDDGYGIPQYLETTYDHFGFGRRRAVVYNAHLYLTALGAARRLAEALSDETVQANVTAAAELGVAATQRVFWNETLGYFRAHSDDGNAQLFTDSLYGQMLAHHNFDGNFSYPSEDQLWRHLAREWEHNADAFGMRVISNPVQEDSIWMNGPPTWSYLALSRLARPVDPLGLPWATAVEPLKRMSENFRSRLHDIWNLRALTHTDTAPVELERGQPREQGHYGFMLTDLFLIPLLSGVHADMANTDPNRRSLRVEPMFAHPYHVPVLLSGCIASLASNISDKSATEVTFTLSVAFGKIELPAGGLIVHGQAYEEQINLSEGQAIVWRIKG